jgi:hypothetical protein
MKRSVEERMPVLAVPVIGEMVRIARSSQQTAAQVPAGFVLNRHLITVSGVCNS